MNTLSTSGRLKLPTIAFKARKHLEGETGFHSQVKFQFLKNLNSQTTRRTKMKKNDIIVALAVCIFLVGSFVLPAAACDRSHPNCSCKDQVTVMTRNLYLGADIFKVVEAAQVDPASVPYAVAEVYQTMLFTNFWARAEAIADEIAKAKPDVIGLQEVVTYYKQTPGDFMAGNPTQATEEVIDFYRVLDDALKDRGMHYVAFTVTDSDVELPMLDLEAGPPYYLSDIRMVDHDVILVRRGNPAWEVLAGNYQAKLELELAGVPVAFCRGFFIVDTIISGKIFRIVNTHLEVHDDPGTVYRLVQYYQMQELLGTIDYLSGLLGHKPIIMVGDFNSSPDDVPGEGYHPLYDAMIPYTPPYMLAVAAGYQDAWLLQKKYDEGYTSGFDESVSDPAAELYERIDLVFLGPELRSAKVECDLVGNKVSDMIPYPDDDFSGIYLWPSDHAGVVAEISCKTLKKVWKKPKAHGPWKRYSRSWR